MTSPITEATLQAAFLSTVSNICAQFISAYQHQRSFSFDTYQLLRFLAVTLITTPPNFLWQQLLERKFPAYAETISEKDRETHEMKAAEEGDGVVTYVEGASRSSPQPIFSLRNTVAKWFIDCMTAGALLNTVAFLVIMGILKHQSGHQIWLNIKENTIPVIVAGYRVWPIASIISFTFVPVRRRIVFLSTVGLVWGIYLSLVAAKV